ncbi:MAG: CdaR family protein [candidate division WOR-3 bacterium]|nr:CdaR family protein [candidate division WOR-3 bacterium]
MDIKNIVTRNIYLKIIALVIAVIIWFNAVINRTVQIERPIDVYIYALPDSMAFTYISDSEIDVLMEGKSSEFILMKLFNNFPVIEINMSEYESHDNSYNIELDRSMFKLLPEINIEILKIEDKSIQFTIDSLRSKDIPVVPRTDNSPAEDYTISSRITTKPSRIEIRGGKSKIEPINYIETEKIDLSGLTSDYSKIVPLSIKETFIEVEPRSVMVSIGIEKLRSKQFTNVPVTYLNYPGNIDIDSMTQSVDVEIRGPSGIVEDLHSGEFSPIIDLSGIRGRGTFSYPVTIDRERVDIISVKPETVRVIVK